MGCDISDDDTKLKLRSYGLITLLIFVCIVLEVISVSCAIVFSSSYDETDSTLPESATALIITGMIGQFICGGCTVWLYNTTEKLEKCSEGCGAFLALGVMALAGI